ncbi:hypothetical protein [Bacillus sp. V59.32b]|uniref:hypothetical protein n=1 Tax=Bacillus sp. V59.32b TaxID=1758642 RepID=UPI000E3CBD3A|nr:hypothetical protein [Bacillus sp. V59.32b]RFU66496.1 hypothetical protein D0463_09055 [Bacillus sp. V59.32b]
MEESHIEFSSSLKKSVNNVRHLINNSILMLRDLDAALSKHGFQPIYGNALGSESSKSINQSMNQFATFLPQYIARPYALKSDIKAGEVNKILFCNTQFFYRDLEDFPPTLINSAIIFPEPVKNVKGYVQYWWLKSAVFESVKWENVKMEGEINNYIDEEDFKTIFWCKDLISISGQKELLQEAEQLVKVFSQN